MADWGDTLGDALRFVVTNRQQRQQYDEGMRESSRRFAIEREAARESRALAKAASDRLAAHDARAAGEQFMGNLSAYEGALPGVAGDEMTELRGSLAADPEGFLRSARNYDLRRAALEKFAPEWKRLEAEKRAAELAKAKAGHASVFDVNGRMQLAQFQAAMRALQEGAKTDVPPSGMYPIEIGPDGKPISHGADDLAERRRAAALAAMSAIFSTAPGAGPSNPPSTSFGAPPAGGPAPATAPPAARPTPKKSGGTQTPATIKMRFKATGQVADIPVADIPKAMISGEWEHVLVPGVAAGR